MKNFLCLLCLIALPLSSFAKPKDKIKDPDHAFVIFSLRTYPGMFASCICVLGFLDLCERGHYAGGRVDFGTTGIYYDPTIGENWWEYYFEPISFHHGKAKKTVQINRQMMVDCGQNGKKLSRERAHELTDRYIKVRPHIQRMIDKFAAKYFTEDTIIGVHYRGTDKSKETPRVPYGSVYREIAKAIAELPHDRYKIFVCTDEEEFLQDVAERFPDKILCTNATRSTDKKPIHFSRTDQYQLGQEALIDCQLLSRTHLLIRTPSYFSQFAGIFNQNLPIILVTE